MSSRIRELEHKLESAEKQLRLFQRISRYMARESNLHETLHNVVALVVEFMQCDSCLLYLLDGDRLVLCASNDEASQAVGKVSLKLDEGLTGWVARERRLLAISREAYSDARFKYFKDLPQDTYESFLSAPVIWRNRVVGVINVQHRTRAFPYRRGTRDDHHGWRAGRLHADVVAGERSRSRGTSS